MKPSWDDAPSWANWLAMDENGEWFWYELQPKKSYARGFWASAGRSKAASQKAKDWDETLEQRP